MEWSAIDVKCLSCRDLVLPISLYGKLPVYAVVSLGDGSGRRGRKQLQSTPFDRKGGRNPEWDLDLRLDLSGEASSGPGSLFLEFDFVARSGTGGILGDRVVGEVRVPVWDLAQEYIEAYCGAERLRSVHYQVRSPDGKPSGVLNFLYRVRFKLEESKLPPASPPPPKQQCPAGGGYDGKPPSSPVKSSSRYYPSPPSPPAAKAVYFPPPPPGTADGACAVQQPGEMYSYGFPAPPPPPPSDPYGYPTIGYDFAGGGYWETWAPPPALPPAATDPYALQWVGYGVAGEACGAGGWGPPPRRSNQHEKRRLF